jgi:hypothetical protein
MSVSNDGQGRGGMPTGGPSPASAEGLLGSQSPLELSGSNAAPLTDSEWHLNLTGLSADLRRLRERVPQTAKAFDPRRPEQTFRDCEADLAGCAHRVWKNFWEQCAPFWDSIYRAREKVRMWPSESYEISARILERSKEAKTGLTEAFRTAICQEADALRPGRPGDVADLEDQVKQARLEIDKHRIAVTGERKGIIPPPKTARAFWIGGLAAMLCGLLEVMADTDFFRQFAGPLAALEAMTLLAIVGSCLAVAVGITGKRWLYWRRASAAFKKNFPDSVIPGTDVAVGFRQLAPECRIIFVLASVSMIVGSVALLVWRIRLAEGNEFLKHAAAIVWLVFAAQWLLALVEFLIGSAYDPKPHVALKALKAELNDVETKLSAARSWREAADAVAFRLPPAAEIDVRHYREVIKELRHELFEAENDARKICDRYLRRREERSDALEDLLVPAYQELLGGLVDAIRAPCLRAGVDPAFSNNMEKIEIARLCAAGDDRTLTLISDFKPAIEFPEGEVIVDFEELYKRMRDEIHEQRTRERIEHYQGELITPIEPLHGGSRKSELYDAHLEKHATFLE